MFQRMITARFFNQGSFKDIIHTAILSPATSL